MIEYILFVGFQTEFILLKTLTPRLIWIYRHP